MNSRDIGKKIKAARLRKGLTQTEAGKKAGGLARGTVCNIESGKKPLLDSLERLARAVGVKI